MKTKSLLDRKAQLAFGSAILTLLVVGAVSYRGIVASGQGSTFRFALAGGERKTMKASGG